MVPSGSLCISPMDSTVNGNLQYIPD